MADSVLRVLLKGDASGLNSSLKTASSRLKTFGSKMKAVGSQLQSFSIPLAIAGGAAAKVAYDFDKSMTQIKSLVGIASDEVDRMGISVREMARETGVSSNEAAEALFFITSAGLRGKEAMDVLGASLKAAAIGLGETKTVADLATSAMNAYGSEVLSANAATDVMVSAVREGKLEASELAGSMGRVLPIASAMGVQFHEVGAAFAALSRTGTNAAEAATQIRGILSSILKPSTQAEEMLNKLSLSSSGLRKSLKEDGLLATLEILKTSFEGNDMAAQTVFGNVRALSGVMDLLGSNVGTTRQIFDNMSESVGAAGKAYDIFAESKSAKMNKAINSAKEAFAELGMVLLDAVLPFIQKLSGFITKAYESFKGLNKGLQNSVLALGGIALVLPTLISLGGTLVTVMGALLSPVGLVVAGLAAIGYIIVENWKPVRKAIVDITNYFIELYNESLGFRLIVESIPAYFKTMWDNGKLFFSLLWRLIKDIGSRIGDVFGGIGDMIKGAFTLDSGLIKEGFQKVSEAATANFKSVLEAGNDLLTGSAENMVKNFGDAFHKAKEAKPLELITEDDVQAGVDKLINGAKGIWEQFSSMFGGNQETKKLEVKTKGPVGLGFDEEQLQKNIIGLTQLGQNLDASKSKTKSLQETFTEWGLSTDAILQDVSYSILGAFESMMAGENVFKSLGDAVLGLLKRLLAAAAAAALLSALLPALGVSKIGNASTSFKGMFGALSGFGTAFANGGIVSSPTLGLVGEYAGARSNPEVIAPLDKLKSLIGDRPAGNVNVTGAFKVQGQDLVVALQRAENLRTRKG